ncbi:MAG TPA: hypothetical protein DG048_15200 [Pseudoalteromonas sp.]|jgi:hypothetical protein|nr:hypothetical protein [Pseudoalteromonas sp.]|tara:strand:+ start:1437 stop:2138 length:702 start_codon:yes stop_codon:yes gene_type:complete
MMSQKIDPRKQKAAAKTKEKSLVSKAEELLMSQYMRSLIYQGSFKSALSFNKFLIVSNILAYAIIVFLVLKPYPKPETYSLDANGRFERIYPLNQDSMTSTQLTQWAVDCVLELNSYTFYSALNHLNKVVPRCLTVNAGQSFISNFEQTILDEMRVNEQSYEASLNGAGIITAEGVVEGRKAYQMQIPIIVTRYDMNRSPKSFKYLIKLEVIRVSQEDFTKGVKIYRYDEVDN